MERKSGRENNEARAWNLTFPQTDPFRWVGMHSSTTTTAITAETAFISVNGSEAGIAPS